MKKYFTVEEANEILPVVKRELEILQGIKRDFEKRYAEWQDLKRRPVQDEDRMFALESRLDFLQIEAGTHIQNIHASGVQLKDIEIGLLDFPAVIHGEEVLLCWKMGEEKISHYHGLHEGFRGRKPLEGNLPHQDRDV